MLHTETELAKQIMVDLVIQGYIGNNLEIWMPKSIYFPIHPRILLLHKKYHT